MNNLAYEVKHDNDPAYEYERTRPQRLLETARSWDEFEALHDRHLLLANGDRHAPLHPEIVKQLDAIRPVVLAFPFGDSESFRAPGGMADKMEAAMMKKFKAWEVAALRSRLAILEAETTEAPATGAAATEQTEDSDNPYMDALISCADFSKITIPKKKYYLFPFLWRGCYGLISGDRGVGKTWFSLGMADAASRGVSFGPWACNEPASVAYVEGEMSLHDDTERIGVMNLDSDRAKPFYMVANAYIQEILNKPVIHLTDDVTRRYLRELILDNHIDVVIFDNIASLTPGIDENSKQEWDAINQFMISLRYAGVSPWLIHHLGKNGEQRGTSGREDNIDMSIKLLAPRDYKQTDGARFIATFNKQRIPHKYLPLLIDREMQYGPDENGNHVWTFGDPDRDNELAVLDMLSRFFQQKDVAKELNLSKGQVSKIRSKLSEKGWIDQNNLLTDAGKSALIKGGYEVET